MFTNVWIRSRRKEIARLVSLRPLSERLKFSRVPFSYHISPQVPETHLATRHRYTCSECRIHRHFSRIRLENRRYLANKVFELVMSESKGLLLGNAALVVWGEVDSSQVDETALNDWWTNEHLPERLSIPGFQRARRYFSRDDSGIQTKYLTLYEVLDLDVLTSQPYMEKLNNPTPGTEKHIPTLATMQRSGCRLVYSEVRQDLLSCTTGLGATAAVFVLSLPPGDELPSALQDLFSNAFVAMQSSIESVMNLIILEEDKAATEPGSSSQSYLNVRLKPASEGGLKKWIVLFEFSSTVGQPLGGIWRFLKPVFDELSHAYGKVGTITLDVYEFMCSVRS